MRIVIEHVPMDKAADLTLGKRVRLDVRAVVTSLGASLVDVGAGNALPGDSCALELETTHIEIGDSE